MPRGTLDAVELRGAHCVQAKTLKPGNVVYQCSDGRFDYRVETVRESQCGHFVIVTTNGDTMSHVFFKEDRVYIECEWKRKERTDAEG